MTGTQCSAVYDFESELKEGDEVRVAWSEFFESVIGRVVRVLASHIDVKITEECDHQHTLMRMPRIKHHTVWSWHNRVEPSGGYFFPVCPNYEEMPFSAEEAGVRLIA